MAQGFTFDASFAGIRIDVLASNIRHGRKTQAHTFPKRDGATNEDMGREPWVCDLQFIFVDRKAQEGETADPGTALDRWKAFDELVESGAIRRLVHPYAGAKRCSISSYTHNADGDGGVEIECSATFTEEESISPTRSLGAGIQKIAGSHEVEAQSVQAGVAVSSSSAGLSVAEQEAAQADLDVAQDTVALWDADPTITTREVHLQMASINNGLSARLEELDAARNIDRYPIMKQFTLLQYQVKLAAEAFTAEDERIVSIETKQRLPLRVIAARFYGAAQAERRFGEMLELNPEIRNPAIIERGTILKAYSPNSEPGR